MRIETECPYCEQEQRIESDRYDNLAGDESEIHQRECTQCGKTFTFTASFHITLTPSKADCLNGGDHEWHAPWTYPAKSTYMTCRNCGLSRPPTEQEWVDIAKEHEL